MLLLSTRMSCRRGVLCEFRRQQFGTKLCRPRISIGCGTKPQVFKYARFCPYMQCYQPPFKLFGFVFIVKWQTYWLTNQLTAVASVRWIHLTLAYLFKVHFLVFFYLRVGLPGYLFTMLSHQTLVCNSLSHVCLVIYVEPRHARIDVFRAKRSLHVCLWERCTAFETDFWMFRLTFGVF